MVFTSYYSWIETTLRKKILSNKSHHLFVAGLTQSGKTYLLNWLGEVAVDKGASKLFIMNCNKRFLLEEQLMFLFPNVDKKDMQKIMRTKTQERNKIIKTMPKGFKVKVYTPISSHCPDKLPENFIPFSIAIDDWDETNLQILYGEKDVSRIKGIYDTQIKYSKKKNQTYSDLKNALRKFKNTEIMRQKGYMGTPVTYFTPKAQRQTIEGFFGRMQQFNEQGILASNSFPYNLKKLLKKELKDQKTIVILNTEYLDNQLMEYFVIAYFVKTLNSLLDDGGMKHQINYKIVLWFDEIRFLFPSTSEHKKNTHVGMSDLGATLLTTGRHDKLEIWLSVQSPSFIPSSLLKNISTKIVTHFKEKDDMDWVAEYFFNYKKDIIRDLFTTFERQRERGEYRFIILEQKFTSLTVDRSKRAGWGNRLPRPRLSFYTSATGENKVPFTNMNILDKDPHTKIDLGIKVTDAMGKAKLELLAQFKEGEEKLTITIKKERENRIRRIAEKQKLLEEEENTKIKKIAAVINLIGENYSQISAKAGVTRDEARTLSGKARGLGLIYELSKIEANKRAITALNKGKKWEQTGMKREELEELIEKAAEYYLIKRTAEEIFTKEGKKDQEQNNSADSDQEKEQLNENTL